MMRTTLTIDDDVLALAKDLAYRQHLSIGEVISGLAREALKPAGRDRRERNGFALLPRRDSGARITPELVASLQDDQPA